MTIAEQINAQFPVRKGAEQKKAFRKWLMQQVSGLGWKARVEENNRGRHQNVIVGDPEHAQVTFTAHYDTPATIGIADLQIPRNFLVYAAVQLAMILGMLLISFVIAYVLGMLTQSGDMLVIGFFLCFVGLIWLQMAGIPNRHNANDNTSGVAALLELMAGIDPEDREKVACIFFDNCEKGSRGSKAYAREHLEMQYTRLVVNLDCVGVGETVLVSAPKLAVQTPQYALLEDCLEKQTGREVRFFSSVTTRGSSDFRSFKCGVGISAHRLVSGVGYYTGDIHTGRDTQCDQGNIDFLSGALSAYVRQL